MYRPEAIILINTIQASNTSNKKELLAQLMINLKIDPNINDLLNQCRAHKNIVPINGQDYRLVDPIRLIVSILPNNYSLEDGHKTRLPQNINELIQELANHGYSNYAGENTDATIHYLGQIGLRNIEPSTDELMDRSINKLLDESGWNNL